MTPARLAEIRRLAGRFRDDVADALGEMLAAYDAIAAGSAVREARAREREAVHRAGDAEERCAERAAENACRREDARLAEAERENAAAIMPSDSGANPLRVGGDMTHRDRLALELAYAWSTYVGGVPRDYVFTLGMMTDALELGGTVCDEILDALPSFRSLPGYRVTERLLRARLALLLRAILRAEQGPSRGYRWTAVDGSGETFTGTRAQCEDRVWWPWRLGHNRARRDGGTITRIHPLWEAAPPMRVTR